MPRDAFKIFSCSSLSAFIDSIVMALRYRGYSESKFYMCEYRGVQFLTKVCFYRKTAPELYGDVSREVVPQADAEIQILKVLRRVIIDRGISPCILELAYDKVCNDVTKLSAPTTKCEKLMLDYNEYNIDEDITQFMCKYVDLVKSGLAHNKCAFLVLEKCDVNFDEYIHKNINTSVSIAVFKSLLFQIIYTIYAITKVYPGFHHYDLHTGNILLKFDPDYQFRADDVKFLVFTVEGRKYYVPYFGIIPKIIDFGFSVIPEEGITSNIVEDLTLMYYRSKNDMIFLFYWIYKTLRESSQSQEIEAILQSLEPNRTYVKYNTEYIRKIENDIPSYLDMIQNKVFKEYSSNRPSPGQIKREYTPP